MTSPRGERFGGVWEFVEISEPASFAVLDYFADGPVAVHSIDGSGSREAVFERIWMILEREPILTR